MNSFSKVLKVSAEFELRTSLLLRSGIEGDFTDSSIEKTPDGKLHISGYAWNSLLRRSLLRIEGGDRLAKLIGKHENGVSPLWCESAIVELPETDAKPGNRMDRRYCSAIEGALFSDELAPTGLTVTMSFNYFYKDNNEAELLKAAFRVIDSGIENIGGGWSYGFGRLRFRKAGFKSLDLKQAGQRELLWKFGRTIRWDRLSLRENLPALANMKIIKPWRILAVSGEISDGQLLAVHSAYPAFDTYQGYADFPDDFVYRRYRITQEGKPVTEAVIPGKAIRQAVLSVSIERRMRSESGELICGSPGEKCRCLPCLERREKVKKEDDPQCICLQCRWFGSTEKGGIIAVTDAEFITEPNAAVLNRIQLCEHSMQNINLFSGEYLTSESGKFRFEIMIDSARAGSAGSPESYICDVLDEMMGGSNAPDGWHRLGATSACTGQLRIGDYEVFSYGE